MVTERFHPAIDPVAEPVQLEVLPQSPERCRIRLECDDSLAIPAACTLNNPTDAPISQTTIVRLQAGREMLPAQSLRLRTPPFDEYSVRLSTLEDVDAELVRNPRKLNSPSRGRRVRA